VKRLIQRDKNIGKLASTTPAVVSKATELLIKNLLTKALTLAEERQDVKLTPYHIAQALSVHEEFRCLAGKVEGLSDSKPPVKKKHKEESKG